MAKSIRLLNVDYIVTSSDKTIDLNNLSLSSANIPAVDGQMSSAGNVFFNGGDQGGSGFVETDKINCTSGATQVWGNHHYGAWYPQTASNGDDFFMYGQSNNLSSQISKQSCKTKANGANYGTLAITIGYPSDGTSDGTTAIGTVGWQGGSTFSDAVHSFSMTDPSSKSATFSSIRTQSMYGTDLSDGTNAYMMSYTDRGNGANTATSYRDSISFQSGASDTTLSNMINSAYHKARGSSDSAGYIYNGSSLEMFAFSSGANAVSASSISGGTTHSGSSDGSSLFYLNTDGQSWNSKAGSVSFIGGSVNTTFGTISRTVRNVGCCSGD